MPYSCGSIDRKHKIDEIYEIWNKTGNKEWKFKKIKSNFSEFEEHLKYEIRLNSELKVTH